MIDQLYTKTELQNKNLKIQNIPKHQLQITMKVIDFKNIMKWLYYLFNIGLKLNQGTEKKFVN